jgi:hypothetical protein
MDLDGSHFRLLHSFVPTEGDVPHGFVIQRGSQIYGMTRLGGITPPASAFASAEDFSNYADGNGVVFRYDLKGGAYTILHSFSYAGSLAAPTLPGGVVDGAVPDHGGLVLSHGRLWGLTTQGGSNGGGVVFSMKPDGSDYRINHSFGSPTGNGDLSQPHGTLMPGANGMLYALTSLGGATGSGGVLRVNPKNGNYRLVYSFTGGAGGVDGIDNPVVTTDGKGHIVLYGMTKLGGAVQSTLLPAPIAEDWKLPQPAQANGVIWRSIFLTLPKCGSSSTLPVPLPWSASVSTRSTSPSGRTAIAQRRTRATPSSGGTSTCSSTTARRSSPRSTPSPTRRPPGR